MPIPIPGKPPNPPNPPKGAPGAGPGAGAGAGAGEGAEAGGAVEAELPPGAGIEPGAPARDPNMLLGF